MIHGVSVAGETGPTLKDPWVASYAPSKDQRMRGDQNTQCMYVVCPSLMCVYIPTLPYLLNHTRTKVPKVSKVPYYTMTSMSAFRGRLDGPIE